jgi:hypothetical protein
VAKHYAFVERAEHEKMKLVEVHAPELAMLHGDLDLETRNYTEYR